MTQCYTKNGNISRRGGGSLKKKVRIRRFRRERG
jgi:hypothetical protein